MINHLPRETQKPIIQPVRFSGLIGTFDRHRFYPPLDEQQTAIINDVGGEWRHLPTPRLPKR